MVSKNNETGTSILIDHSKREIVIGSFNRGFLFEITKFSIGRSVEIKTVGKGQKLELRIISEIDKTENGISMLVDYLKKEIIVKSSSGGKLKTITLNIGYFVELETRGGEKDLKLTLFMPNKSFNNNLGNVSRKTELKTVSDDVQTRIKPEISPDSSLVDSPKICNDKSSIAQVALSSVTAEDLAEEIEDIITLGKNESRILVALIKEGSTARNRIYEITGITVSNVSVSVARLIRFGLVYYDGKNLIKPNLERISVSCSWLFSKEIQEVILNIRPEDCSKFGFGKPVEYILYLLYKHRDGLYKNTIIDGTGLKYLGFHNAKKTLLGNNMIEVVKRGEEEIILPKFSVDQIGENPVTLESQTVADSDSVQEITEAEEPTVNIDEKESITSKEPIIIETDPVPKTVEVKKSTADFIEEKLLSLISRIINGSSIGLHKISSDFGVKKNDERLVELLNVINKEVEIEIVEADTDGVTISWNQKYFKNIELENFLVRKFSGEQIKDERGQEEDTEEQEISPDLYIDSNTGSTESENNNIATEEEQTKDKGGLEEDKECIEQKATTDDIKPDEPPINKTMLKEVIEELKPEDIKKQIERMIAIPNLGDPHKIVLSILLDNYLSNSSLKMEVSDLIENAIKQNLGEAQVRGCFGGLQALKFIKKPNQIIELSI